MVIYCIIKRFNTNSVTEKKKFFFLLAGIPRPPGAFDADTDKSCAYDCQCVGRDAIEQHQTYKIPIEPISLGDRVAWTSPINGAMV